jgi:hypothetical protein
VFVRVFDQDRAFIARLEAKGVNVERVALADAKLTDAYDNLSFLIENKQISYPADRYLLAELQLFSFGGNSDASDSGIQIAQQSAILALCLVTFDFVREEWGHLYTIRSDSYCERVRIPRSLLRPSILELPKGHQRTGLR